MLDVRVVIFPSAPLKVQGLVRQGYRKEFRFACNVYFPSFYVCLLLYFYGVNCSIEVFCHGS